MNQARAIPVSTLRHTLVGCASCARATLTDPTCRTSVPPSAPTPRLRLSAFQRLAIATVLATLALIAIGGAVRATDSGLACPTWPGCFSAGDFLPPAGLNVWLEHTHRLAAGVVGLMIAALLVWAVVRHRDRPSVLWPAVGAAVAVNVQAALGALVVLHLLRAELVTAHLGMGMAVVGFLLYLTVNVSLPRPSRAQGAGRDLRLARASLAAAGLTYLQILVGGHVTGVGAGLAYVDFPALGLVTFAPVGSEAEAYNVVHRVLAVLLLAGVMVLFARARRLGASGWLLRLPRIAAWLVALQVLLGIANLASGLSFLSVIPHLAVASWLWAVLVLQTVLAYRLAPAGSGSGADRPSTAGALAGSSR
jgi:cytochrome c oxidase assembly protein subunit 15